MQGPPDNLLASTFNTDVWAQYVESEPPKATILQVHQAQEAEKLTLDIRRCRANCLKEATFDLPVFSCLDYVEAAQPGELYDLAYVDSGATLSNAQRVLSHAPYQGPGWYTKPAQQFCLHHAILKWDDFKLGIRASGHLPSDCLAQGLSWIQEAWAALGSENEKRSLNAFCGLLVETAQHSWSLRTTSEECDAEMEPGWFCKS